MMYTSHQMCMYLLILNLKKSALIGSQENECKKNPHELWGVLDMLDRSVYLSTDGQTFK